MKKGRFVIAAIVLLMICGFIYFDNKKVVHSATYYCSECSEPLTISGDRAGTCMDPEVSFTGICKNTSCLMYDVEVNSGKDSSGNDVTFIHSSAGTHGDIAKEYIQEATCTSEGIYEGYCELCGEMISEGTEPALGHDWVFDSTTKEATCEEAGTALYVCQRESSARVTEERTIAALGHNYSSKVTTAATCTAAGVKTYTCANCKNTYTEAIAATGHNYSSKITTAATCTTAGVKTYTCANCNNTYTETIAATGHTSDGGKVTKAATCTASGTKTYTCTTCKATIKTETIAATGHTSDGGKVTTAATCTTSGTKTYTCTTCKSTIKTETIAATGHTSDGGKVTTAATCTASGTKTYTCTTCKATIKTETIAATGHDYVPEETDATCTEIGTTTYTCSKCNDTYTVSGEALGHDYVEEIIEATCTENGSKKQVCSRCGDTIEEIIECGHSFPEDWTIETEATEDHPGLQVKICTVCQERLEEEIPQLEKSLNIVPIVAGVTVVTAGGYILLKSIAAKKAVDTVVTKAATDVGTAAASERVGTAQVNVSEEVGAAGVALGVATVASEFALGKPSFSEKTIALCLDECDYKESFTNVCKSRSFLEVIESDEESIVEDASGAELVIMNYPKEKADALMEAISAENEGMKYCLIVDGRIGNYDTEEINYIKKRNDYVMLVNALLPLYKPSLKSDDTLEYIGEIADAFDIPFVSTVINAFISGKEIKETLQEEEKGVVEVSTIVGDIASILGLDAVSTVTDFIDSVDTVKSSIESIKEGEEGAYEAHSGISSAKDIVDTIKDIIE